MKKFLAVCLLASLLLNAVLLLRPRHEESLPAPVAPRAAPAPPPPVENPAREGVEAPPKPDPVIPPPAGHGFAPRAGPRTTPPTVSLIISPAYAAPGGEVTVTCTVHSGEVSPRDWIGLYPSGAETPRYSSYLMVTGRTQTYTFKAPPKPGLYEARYVLDDERTSVATSNSFSVLGEAALPPQVTLTNLTATVRRGGEIPIRWTHLTGRPAPTDWVGLYEPDAKNENFISWKYVTDAASGQVSLTAPDKPGVYEIRYLLDNGYESVAVGPRIVVVE